jgi:hypothetical protein|tara:strand:+ start:880 stop:1230 length:351 start_codon:yes stop_codon:yes gene_type:complete
MINEIIQNLPENETSVFNYISLAVGSLSGIAVALIQYRNRNKEAKTLDYKLKVISEKLNETRLDLEAQKEISRQAQSKWASLKASFRLIYNQYELESKGDKDKMSMLKDIKELFNL